MGAYIEYQLLDGTTRRQPLEPGSREEQAADALVAAAGNPEQVPAELRDEARRLLDERPLAAEIDRDAPIVIVDTNGNTWLYHR